MYRHGLRPRDDRLVEKRRVKGLVSLSKFTLHSSLFHLPVHSGSPRAFLNALAMTRVSESARPNTNLFSEQIPQDFFGQSFVNLSMAGNRLGQTLIRVMINIVLGSVPEQLATTFLELLDESDSLHATSS